MRKWIFLGFAILLLTAQGSADLKSKISKSCPAGYEPLVSMANPNETFNNIGTPSRYSYKVCVEGIIDVTFKTRCPGTTSFYISSNSTYAHFSEVAGYNIGVCTESMVTKVSDSCSDGNTPLFSVSDKINGFGRHIAGLNSGKKYGNIVCAFSAPPANVTLNMKFNLSSTDEVYFDDQRVNGEFSETGIAEFPYIVSTDGDTVSGIVVKDYKRISRTIEDQNVLGARKDKEKASFYVPFTTGGHETIEDRQEEFFETPIENSRNPTFGFSSLGTPTIRAIARQDIVVVSNLSIGGGSHTIEIEKVGENKVRIAEK